MRRIENVLHGVLVLLMTVTALLIGTSLSRFQTKVHAACGQLCGQSNPQNPNCPSNCPFCVHYGSCGGNTGCYACSLT